MTMRQKLLCENDSQHTAVFDIKPLWYSKEIINKSKIFSKEIFPQRISHVILKYAFLAQLSE